MATKKATKKKKKRRGGILAALLLTLAASAVFLFVFHGGYSVRLSGEADVTAELGRPFEDPGAAGRWLLSAADVAVSGEVDTDRPGTYTLTYRVGNSLLGTEVSRTVRVADTEPPVLTLYETPGAYTLPGTSYEEEGFSAVDRIDGDLTDRVERLEADDSVIYRVTDNSGNTATAVRRINYCDPIPPTLTLLYGSTVPVVIGEEFVEPGYVAADNVDGDITDRVVREVGSDAVLYSVTDSSGNRTEAVRHLYYYDPLPPTLTLHGDAEITITAGEPFEEPGWTAEDNADGDLTDAVTVIGTVDPYASGEYVLTYTVEDTSRNFTSAVRRIIVEPKPQQDPAVPTGRVVYLTFDDGPSRYTEKLLDILDKYNVKATFFVVDYGYRDMIGRAAAAGHSIGVHSATHDFKQIYASVEAYFDDLNKMNEIVRQQTGSYTTMIRFPGGSSNTSSRFNPGIMTRLVQAVTDAGYQYFDWNVQSGDAGLTRDPDELFSNVVEGIKAHSVSVVLMHDSKGYMVDTVERILIWGIENGCTFLPLTPDSPGAHHPVNN